MPRRAVAPPSYPGNFTEPLRSSSPELRERVPSIEMKDLHIHAPPLPPDPEDEKGYPDLVYGGGEPAVGGHYGTESFCTLPRRPCCRQAWT